MKVPTIVLLSSLLLMVVIDKVPAPNAMCPCPATSSMGYCPYPGDCEKFIQCNGFDEHIHKCGDGTIWYQHLRTCGHGFKMYNCTNSPVAFVCPSVNNTFHPDPLDCTGFIQCWGTIPHHMKCPEDQMWSQQNETCILGQCY